MQMLKFCVEITWDEKVVNGIQTENKTYDIIDRSIDYIFDKLINQLSEEYKTQLSVTNFAEHNAFKRHDHIVWEGKKIGLITVSVVTP